MWNGVFTKPLFLINSIFPFKECQIVVRENDIHEPNKTCPKASIVVSLIDFQPLSGFFWIDQPRLLMLLLDRYLYQWIDWCPRSIEACLKPCSHILYTLTHRDPFSVCLSAYPVLYQSVHCTVLVHLSRWHSCSVELHCLLAMNSFSHLWSELWNTILTLSTDCPAVWQAERLTLRPLTTAAQVQFAPTSCEIVRGHQIR